MSLPPRTALQTALDRALRQGASDAAPRSPSSPSSAPLTSASPPPGVSPTRAVVRAAAAAKKAARAQASRALTRSRIENSTNGNTDANGRTSPRGRKRRRAAPLARAPAQRITDLGALARQLQEQQAMAQALEQARRAAAAKREAEQQLFARAVGPVTPLRLHNLAPLPTLAPEPLPLQLWLDEERALLESISDDFDVSTLLDTDDQLSYRRSGIGVEITQRLRAGHWSIQHQLDLHGLRVDEAREALGQFIRQAHQRGLRCLRVVHGKGLGSPGKTPVLKGRVQRWLVQKNEVLAFVQARPADGGGGALVVLLQLAGLRKN